MSNIKKNEINFLISQKTRIFAHRERRIVIYYNKKYLAMTKADIINEIANSTGMQKKEVAVVIESFMSTVKESLLKRKENVYLRGFGSFIIKHRAAKTARNILKNTTMTIEAHDLPSFKPAKSFIDEMKA
ncbi:DNA-binding protein HU [Hoylesella oralis ATCC 33269]|uniref:DNA-binding protein HU n=2 Tax=Bacteroidales TaxID=171549 RepID=E7RSC8_9BACT|nr:DNA-binding protein HU [Hoylesella oralis ATCC 33269]